MKAVGGDKQRGHSRRHAGFNDRWDAMSRDEQTANGRNLRLSPAAFDWLAAYPFPGNVRELRNMLERACLLCDGDEIQVSHLSGGQIPLMAKPPSDPPRKVQRRKLNERELADAISRFDGSRQALAKHLGLSERTLYRRMKNLQN